MSEYKEKLKDPRWQKKRLQIFERDDWCCQKCGDDETTLVVHHRLYRQNTDPWNYHEYELISLCENCHEDERENWVEAINTLCSAVKLTLWAEDARTLAGGLANMAMSSEVFTMLTNLLLKDKTAQDSVMEILREQLRKGHNPQ